MEELYNTPEIQAAQQSANQSSQTAIDYQSAAALFPQKLKEAIQGKLDYNRDLIEQKNKAMTEYFQAPSAAREKYQDIYNPFQREALVTQARSNAYMPYANLVDLLTERQGTIKDIIGEATGAFGSQVTAQQGAAQLARQKWEDLVGMADKLVGIKQWEREMSEKEKSGSGAEMDEISIMEMIQQKDLDGDGLIAGFMPATGAQSSYEEPPMTSAREGVEVEYPPSSGIIWVGDGKGGWK